MDQAIEQIVDTIEIKVNEGDKELLQFLFIHDIDTLNRLLIIFNSPGTPTLKQVFKAVFTGSYRFKQNRKRASTTACSEKH